MPEAIFHQEFHGSESTQSHRENLDSAKFFVDLLSKFRATVRRDHGSEHTEPLGLH